MKKYRILPLVAIRSRVFDLTVAEINCFVKLDAEDMLSREIVLSDEDVLIVTLKFGGKAKLGLIT